MARSFQCFPPRQTASPGLAVERGGKQKKTTWLYRDHLTLAEYAELDAILAEFGRNVAGLEAAAEIMQMPLARLTACAGRNPELMRVPVITVGGEKEPPPGAA